MEWQLLESDIAKLPTTEEDMNWTVTFNDSSTKLYYGFNLPDLIDVLHSESTHKHYPIKIEEK